MNISDVKIFEHNLGTGNVTGKIAILFGGLSASNPKSYMDKVVNEYVGNNPYTQFIDELIELSEKKEDRKLLKLLTMLNNCKNE